MAIQLRNIKIKEPENAASELENFIRSSVTGPGEYNLLYEVGALQSVIQIDARNPSSVTCYTIDLAGRPATKPLQDGVKNGIQSAFPQTIPNELVDISGEKRRQAMFAALHTGQEATPNYQDTAKSITPEEAVANIGSYRDRTAAAALKQAIKPIPSVTGSKSVTAKVSNALHAFGLWRRNKDAIKPTPAPVQQSDQENKQKFRKG